MVQYECRELCCVIYHLWLCQTGGNFVVILFHVYSVCVRIMNRPGSLTTTARELSRYKLDLVVVQEVT